MRIERSRAKRAKVSKAEQTEQLEEKQSHKEAEQNAKYSVDRTMDILWTVCGSCLKHVVPFCPRGPRLQTEAIMSRDVDSTLPEIKSTNVSEAWVARPETSH